MRRAIVACALAFSALAAPSAAVAADAAPPFPRRLLAIRVNNYLYANPVTSGYRDEKGEFRHTVPAMMANIADRLHVDPGQFVDLSDSTPGERTRAPLKVVIQEAVDQFLNGSRPQDRILIYFAGHAVVIDDEPHLVPLDGELGARATLIPLRWLYDRLARCRARQKVLVLDVCRFDPERGWERPGSAAMGPQLEAAIRTPPAGVQVWSACRAGEFSYEFEIRGLVPGGAFLHTLHEVLIQGKLIGDQRPEDALPIEALARAVGERTRRLVQESEEAAQTPLLGGSAAPGGAAYNPKEPLPAKLVLKELPLQDGEFAGLGAILSILNETDVVPPAKPVPPELARLKPGALPLFSARLMAEYQPDDKNSPLREAVRKAVAVMRKHATTFPDQFSVPVGDEDAFRARIVQIQKRTALALLELDEALEELARASAERRLESSRRWQANYDYVLARLLNRIAYVYEYNSALGSLRREFPPRDPRLHRGWRLVAQEQLTGDRMGKKLAANARKILEGLVQFHRGTPWEVLARRELATGLGLSWRAVRFGE